MLPPTDDFNININNNNTNIETNTLISPPLMTFESTIPETSASSSGSREKRRRPTDSIFKSKTLQACDRCRIKKTKCEPGPSPTSAKDSESQCQSCHAAGLNCTFDLPITASRSKRIRNGMSVPAPSSETELHEQQVGLTTDRDREVVAGPSRSDLSSNTVEARSELRDGGNVSAIPRLRKNKTTVISREGPTSLSYILHSHPTLPLSSLHEFDLTNGWTMESESPPSSAGGNGDGYMSITSTSSIEEVIGEPTGIVLKALQSESWSEVISRLVELYLLHISPLIPIVTREEMSQSQSQGQSQVDDLLLYAMASVAAARSNCLKEIFLALRLVLIKNLHAQAVMSEPSRQNVQILLVTCLVDDLGVQYGGSIYPSHSVQRTRLSAAILMAKDLGMDLSHEDTGGDVRIWQCARILDTWNAARTGLSPIIASSISPSLPTTSPSRPPDFLFHLSKLTDLLHRVLTLLYSRNGVKTVVNSSLLSLRDDLASYPLSLPVEYRSNGLWSSLPCGLLNILHTSITLLLYRPFMRFSFICPSNLELDLNLQVWNFLTTSSRQSLEWLTNQDEHADLLFFGPYALGLCALIQYHDWARRRQFDAVLVLDRAKKEAVDRWLERLPSGHLPLRRQQLEISNLLHSVTQNPAPSSSFSSPRGLNPTPGILNRLPETPIFGVAFLRDPSHPKGGILVASQKAAREVKDLPEGTVIIGGPPQDTDTATTGSGAGTGGWDISQALLNAGHGGVNELQSMTMSSTDWEATVASFAFGGGFQGNLSAV